MKAGDCVGLRAALGTPLSDAHGPEIAFHITAAETLAGHGAWYHLHTAHCAAQEIFGGWHTGLALTPIPPIRLTEGPPQL
ncbi:hypothetical protein [Streptomyces sp. NBC_01304]|uniref:hypothetical protein n=1 Tax=Streptomyces sp. NBC_01304 TaxID=2903818 RepID=UPI002E10CF56|nr:hypothetical protein OG430_33010 [Streptomyces sp. NBC_01304]